MIKKNKKFPKFLAESLDGKGKSLIIPPGKSPQQPKDMIPRSLLKPFVDALQSKDWQITTAESTIKVEGAADKGKTFKQVITPHLSKGQALGSSRKTGPDMTEFMVEPLVSVKEEVIFGWTVSRDSTEKLETNRGLIVLVTKITVINPKGQKKVFTPTEDDVLQSVMHEISAHAGRITEGSPSGHGDPEVDDIAQEVAEFFQDATGTTGFKSTATEIFNFIDTTTLKK
jgi:hypothetical protein